MLGGHQENSLRAGTQNTPYIVAMGEAAKLAKENLDYELKEVKRLRDKLQEGIYKGFVSGIGDALFEKIKDKITV